MIKITDKFGRDPVFWQWDVNRTLLVSGTKEAPVLHFACADLRRALTVVADPTDKAGVYECKVPNFAMQFEGSMCVSVFEQEGENTEGITTFAKVYNVRPRMKPEDYTYEENIGYINWVIVSENAKKSSE